MAIATGPASDADSRRGEAAPTAVVDAGSVAVSCVLPGVPVDTTEEGPSDASGDAVINADHICNDDLAPGIGRDQ